MRTSRSDLYAAPLSKVVPKELRHRHLGKAYTVDKLPQCIGRGMHQFRKEVIDWLVGVADGIECEPSPIPRVHFSAESLCYLADVEDETVSFRARIAVPLASNAVLAIKHSVFEMSRKRK
jgi:hypothetical protein